MYNLIVGAVEGILPAERLLEVVEDGVEDFVGSKQNPNGGRLMMLPTLLMPEIDAQSHDQTAQVGNVVSLSRTGRDYRFKFVPSVTIQSIPSEYVQEIAEKLHIGRWDLTRTRWSVKSCDLYQVLLDENVVGMPSPKVFSVPLGRPERNVIGVMMPFGAAFDSVWDALKATAADGGWKCLRADDIWEDDVVINDVVSLIARSKVVICDLTDRNSNVFYEAGIAHALGREVILITQTAQDVPFDLRHYRYVTYLGNVEGVGPTEGRPSSAVAHAHGEIAAQTMCRPHRRRSRRRDEATPGKQCAGSRSGRSSFRTTPDNLARHPGWTPTPVIPRKGRSCPALPLSY